MTKSGRKQLRPRVGRRHPSKRRPLLLIIALAAVLAVSLTTYFVFRDRGVGDVSAVSPKQAAPTDSTTGTVSTKSIPSTAWARLGRLNAPFFQNKIIIPQGQTLAGMLAGQGLRPSEVQIILDRVRFLLDLKTFQAGREMRFFKDREGRAEVIEYDRSEMDFLRVERQAGGFRAETLPTPIEMRRCALEGRIEDSLIGAFNRAGEGDLLALDFAEIFAWDVDFYIDSQRGDRFRLLFEKRWKRGQPAGYGRILAAEYLNQGRLIQAYRFTYPDTGQSDYFDAAGNSLRKAFLKSPLKYGRITSRFTSSRLNPVYKIFRPHYGVDYAAPVGTPVRATADGDILAAGWSGGAGRMVKIKHRGGYETLYLHLSGFGEGIRDGAGVESGQVIGYVGTSGDSTGPHLDYRILEHGKYINPLGARFQPAEPLRPEFRDAYRRQAAEYRLVQDLESLPRQALARLGAFWGRIYTFHFPSLLPKNTAQK